MTMTFIIPLEVGRRIEDKDNCKNRYNYSFSGLEHSGNSGRVVFSEGSIFRMQHDCMISVRQSHFLN